MKHFLFMLSILSSFQLLAETSWDIRCQEVERSANSSGNSVYVGGVGDSAEVAELKRKVDYKALANKVIEKIRENCAGRINERNPANTPMEFVDDVYIAECKKLFWPDESIPLTPNNRIAFHDCLDTASTLFGFGLTRFDEGVKRALSRSNNSESADCRDVAVSSGSRSVVEKDIDSYPSQSRQKKSSSVTSQ